MKIEIEFDSSYEATLTIDGRKMQYGYRDGVWSFLEGLSDDEADFTIGGITAVKIVEPLAEILQGWVPDEESPDNDMWETWERLTQTASDEVYYAML